MNPKKKQFFFDAVDIDLLTRALRFWRDNTDPAGINNAKGHASARNFVMRRIEEMLKRLGQQ